MLSVSGQPLQPGSTQDQIQIQDQVPELKSASTATTTHQANGRTPIRKVPTCNICRRRKIKCDRGDPCLNCVRSGSKCVTPSPSGAPRGRQGGRRKLDGELLDRIAKLESLVKDIEGGSGGTHPTPPAAGDLDQTV